MTRPQSSLMRNEDDALPSSTASNKFLIRDDWGRVRDRTVITGSVKRGKIFGPNEDESC